MLFLLKPRCTTCILLLFLQILTKSTMLFKRQIRIKNKYFGSSFTGRISIAANLTGSSAVENNAVITIGEGCTWKLTGDCTITSLTNNGTIDFNGYTITLADGSVLK